LKSRLSGEFQVAYRENRGLCAFSLHVLNSPSFYLDAPHCSTLSAPPSAARLPPKLTVCNTNQATKLNTLVTGILQGDRLGWHSEGEDIVAVAQQTNALTERFQGQSP